MAAEAADIKAALQARILDVLAALGIQGQRAGSYYMARNPTRNDARPGSFWVRIQGTGIGVWSDEATGDGASQGGGNGQHKGDIFGLISYIKGVPFRDAMTWARDFLGRERMTSEALRNARRFVANSREGEEARFQKQLAHNRRVAFSHWLKASDKLTASPVESYLRTRGIELSALARPPGPLRFGARRHIEANVTLPAMLALITGPNDEPWAVHCTFLAPDGTGKADVTPVRKIWPSFAGGVIRLARGETGLSHKAAAAQGLRDTLVLCEGVEDGLSIALACPEFRVWAVASLGNLGRVTLPECCADVIVAADNDWGKRQAAELLDKGVAALERQGRRVRIARSHIGKDSNDALRSNG